MELTVKQLKNRDPGSGMAVIDREALQEIGVSSGDFVAIEGRDGGRAVARVWPSDTSDAGRGIIRIDGQLRQAGGVSIDDRVEVDKTEVEPADRITVALPRNLRIGGDLASHLRDHLVDQAVTAGQTVAFPIGFGMFSGQSGRRVPLTIVDTRPSGTVVVRNTTDIEIADRSAGEVDVEPGEPERSTAPAVTYEDVGGLDDELEQVREMIELPMRHPELFQPPIFTPTKAAVAIPMTNSAESAIERASTVNSAKGH